jgi:hypothetical protein
VVSTPGLRGSEEGKELLGVATRSTNPLCSAQLHPGPSIALIRASAWSSTLAIRLHSKPHQPKDPLMPPDVLRGGGADKSTPLYGRRSEDNLGYPKGIGAYNGGPSNPKTCPTLKRL